MALYEQLSAASTPEDIAAAYNEFVGLAGGDTAAVQQQAIDYLSTLGIGAPTISQAYNIYSQPQAEAPAVQSPLATVAGTLSKANSDTVSNAPANVLGGVILAGDSWLAGDEKTNLANSAFGQNVTNVAVGGYKTQDVLNQLNAFESQGGTFAPGTTVVLDIGANDIASGVDRDTVRSNINEIVSRLDAVGVNVVLSGAPTATSYADAIARSDLKMDDLYRDVASNNSNVTLVDAMSGLLNDKTLMDESGFHLKDDASKALFINQLADAYQSLTPLQKTAVSNKVADAGSSDPASLAKAIDEVAGTNLATTSTKSQAVDLTKATDLNNGTFLTPSGQIVDSEGSLVKDTGSSATATLTQQILAQNLTDKWSGQGYGTAQANAADMAGIMASIGITDINQFGEITKTIPAYYIDTENGQEYVPEQTVKTYGNKLTGQEVPNTYSERQTGNAWGGTFAGSGNTGYRVQFTPDGKPIFYTTGASSSDIGQIAPFLAIAQFIPGVAPFAMALNAAIAIDQGDVLGGLASMAGLGGYTDIATGLRVAKAIDQGDMGALAMSLLQNETVGQMAGSTMLTDTISLADAGNAYSVADNVSKGNYAGALNSLGTLTGSADTKTAGAALNLVNAINSGNEVAIINAVAGLNNTIKAADNLANANIAKSVATSVSSGADAFVQAKQAGATDEDALSAANTVTGTTKTTQVTDNRAQNTLNLDNADVNSLDEAAALAIAKGNDSFTVDGKTYIVNKATGDLPADEKQAADTRLVKSYLNSLGKTDVAQLTDAERQNYLNNYDKFTAGGTGVLKAATLADVLSGNSTYSAAESIENSKYTNPFTVEVRGVGSTGVETTPEVSNVAKAGDELTKWANSLTGPEADTIKQLISTTSGLLGEQLADIGTAASQTGLVGRYNALVQFGQQLEKVGKDLEIPAVTAANQNFWDKVQAEEGYTGKLAAALKAIQEQPLALVAAAKEVGQEALPMLLGGAAFKYGGKMLGVLTDMSANALESMGSNNRQTFNDELAKGTPADQAEKIAERNGILAGAITMGTAGLVDTTLIKSYEKALEKFTGRVAAGAGKEFPEESFEELAIALATGDDLNTALTKSVIGGFTGAKASGTISGVSGTSHGSVNTELKNAFAEQGLTSTDGSFRPETITKITDTGAGTTGGKTTVTEVDTGASTNAATDFASIFETTGNTTQAVDSSVSNAVSNGANVDTTISSVVNAATNTGANANAVAATAANAAVLSGANVTTASNAATTAASNVTTGTNTTTGANTNTGTNANSNTSTNANTGVTTNTTVDTNTNSATTTTTNTNTNTNTSVNTNTNTNINTTVNTNNNTGINTNTTVDNNTGVTTNTVTDTNTNTTATITTNTDTGEVTSVDGPVTVINKDVVKIGDTVVNINTGEVLDPSVVTKTTPVTKTPTTPSTPSKQVLMGGSGLIEPTYAAKDHDISETWLGGRFRNIAPLAGMGILMPESTPMFQETQALSALRRAAGLEDEAKKPEADYYAYGTEPSYSKVLEPFMNGGTVQNHADGGKIMASPLMAASGGDVPHKGSHYVQGAGGGQDDLIPAKLADGEYVFDAEIVAALGDGSNKEGAKKLDAMREAIRKHKRGGSLKSIPPKAKSPLAYLKGAL